MKGGRREERREEEEKEEETLNGSPPGGKLLNLKEGLEKVRPCGARLSPLSLDSWALD